MHDNNHPAPSLRDYDFILQHGEGPRGTFNASGSKTGRILVVLGGAIALIIVAVITMSLLNSGNTAGTDMLAAAQQQTELVRVADIGMQKAHDPATQNFAATIKTTLESQQKSTTEVLAKLKVKANPKLLALGANPKTDTLLEQAEQTNQFDTVFTKTITEQLTTYQASLKTAYDAVSSKSIKQTLNDQYRQVALLLGAPSNTGTSDASSTDSNPAPASSSNATTVTVQE